MLGTMPRTRSGILKSYHSSRFHCQVARRSRGQQASPLPDAILSSIFASLSLLDFSLFMMSSTLICCGWNNRIYCHRLRYVNNYFTSPSTHDVYPRSIRLITLQNRTQISSHITSKASSWQNWLRRYATNTTTLGLLSVPLKGTAVYDHRPVLCRLFSLFRPFHIFIDDLMLWARPLYSHYWVSRVSAYHFLMSTPPVFHGVALPTRILRMAQNLQGWESTVITSSNTSGGHRYSAIWCCTPLNTSWSNTQSTHLVFKCRKLPFTRHTSNKNCYSYILDNAPLQFGTYSYWLYILWSCTLIPYSAMLS